jgi:hypothetical protein
MVFVFVGKVQRGRMTKVVSLDLNLAELGKLSCTCLVPSHFRIDNVIACGWSLQDASGGMWGIITEAEEFSGLHLYKKDTSADLFNEL